MLIKKAYQGEFNHLLSILRLAVLDNRSYVAFPKNKFNYKRILNMLQSFGFIEGYEERSEIMILRLKQTYWKSFREPIKAFSSVEAFKISKAGAIKCKNLKKQVQATGQSPFIAISTDSGVLSGQMAVQKNTGGLPLFIIY